MHVITREINSARRSLRSFEGSLRRLAAMLSQLDGQI